jgi:hypothetical protein
MLVKVKGAVKPTGWCITTVVARPPGPTARSRDYAAGVERKKGAREKPETVIPTSR